MNVHKLAILATAIIALCAQGGGNYVITDKSQTIPALSGDDTLTIRLATVGAQEYVWLEGDNSDWNGVLDIQQGIVAVSNAAALGTAVVYNTNETFAARTMHNARLDLYTDIALPNEIHIGTETPLGPGPRILVQGHGDAVLNGTLYFTKGYVRVCEGSTLTLAGDIISSVGTSYAAGSFFVMHDWFAGAKSTRFFVTGRFTNLDTLYADGVNTGVKIMTAGQGIKWPVATHGGTIVCGVDDAFDSAHLIGRNLANISMSYFDLNGTSQSFENNDELSHDSGVRIRNSNEHVKGRIQITQTRENAASNLGAVGPLDFVKAGSEMLVLTNRFQIDGTLDVAEGTLKLTGPQTAIASQVVVRAGATLDLGGKSYSCRELSLQGGIVRNGTLLGVTNHIYSGSVGATLAGGTTVKSGTDTVELTGGIAFGRSTLTNGLVCCYHFDSDETLLQDAGPYGYTLENCWTNARYRVAASKGPVVFDPDAGRYGSGSARFSEHVFLSYPGGYPAKAPRGHDPLTLAFWFRVRDGQTGNRGLCFLGKAAVGEGLGMCLWDSTQTILSYLWGFENETLLSPTDGSGTFGDGEWHSVVQVWDGSLYRVYIDGAESMQTPCTASVTRTKGTPLDITPDSFYVGTGWNNMYLAGWMDEVALWNRALTPDDVAEYIAHGVPTGQTPEPTPATLTVEAGAVNLSDATFSAGLTNGIVLNYRFDTPETLYTDSGPHGYTLTEGTKNMRFPTGGTKVKCATGEGEWAHGGGAAYFDGTNNLVLANGVNDGIAQPDMIPQGAAPFTLGFFFRRATKYPANTSAAPDYTNDGLIFYGTEQKMAMNGYAFWYWQSQLWNYTGNTRDEYLLPATEDRVFEIFRTGWHSVVQTWDGTVMRYWIDGEEIVPELKNPSGSTRTLNTPPNMGSKWFYISGAFNNPFFKGWMDDITIWNRALSEREIMAFVNYGLDFAQSAATVYTNSGNMTMNAGTSAVVRTVGGVDTVLRTDGMTIIILR